MDDKLTLPSAKRLYDAIMGVIEPDLLTDELSRLNERFSSDTPKQKLARIARYKKAYAMYDRLFKEWVTTPFQAVEKYSKALKRGQEQQEIRNIESSIDSAAA